MKEVIKVIKENLSFKELPKNLREALIDDSANWMVIAFDEGAYTKRTALKDAKYHFENYNDKEYVLYHSNFHGICCHTHNEFYDLED
jgi:acetylornithine/succinyldiaminopimelate/putrescine aminotransferase